MSRYLVTGATGFLGAEVVRALARQGHEAVPFSRGSGGDVLDASSVAVAARGCAGAFHCAGSVSRDPGRAEELYRVHAEGTKNVLDACAAAAHRRVVVASTSGTVAVSESRDHVATEDDDTPIALVARWPYYRAKLFAERAALARNGPTFEVVCVNPSLLLGPGDLRGSSTQDIRRFLEGHIPAVPAGGLSFVDARDAAAARCLAMERGRAGTRYLIGACNLTVADFFARLSRVSNVPAPWLPLPKSRSFARFGASWRRPASGRPGGDGRDHRGGRSRGCRDGTVLLVPRREQSRSGARVERSRSERDAVRDGGGFARPRCRVAAPGGIDRVLATRGRTRSSSWPQGPYPRTLACVIKVHKYGPAFGLPDASPFVVKLETYLRMTGQKYETVTGDVRKAPRKQLPLIEIDGKVVPDSSAILDLLESGRPEKLDARLGAKDAAVALAFKSMLEEHLYFGVLFMRWATDEGWAVFEPALKDMLGTMGVPALMRGLIAKSARKYTVGRTQTQGLGRKPRTEIVAVCAKLVDAFSEYMGDKAYFCGNELTTYDATGYAFVAGILCPAFDNELRRHAASKTNLVAYTERMKEKYWKE